MKRRRRVPGADTMAERETIILPGDDTKPPTTTTGREEWEPTIILQEGIREVTATTLAEEHNTIRSIQHELQSAPDAEDWGDGWTTFAEPAHILRGPDGGITSIIPLSELPGVEYTPKEREAAIEAKEAKPTPVPLSRSERHKLVTVLTRRLFLYYQQLPKDYPGYNPFRDGVPEKPAGAPNFLRPDPDELYPATNGQIWDYLYKQVGQRTEVINKRRFGGGIQDLALRIQ